MMRKNNRTVHFVSLGCAKNRVDTEVMAGIVVAQGYRIVPEPAEAKVIVVNTCAFIESAKKESIEKLLEMSQYKSKGNAPLLVAAGCLSQRFGNELVKGIPELDYLLGTSNLNRIEQVANGTASKLEIPEPGNFLQNKDTPRFIPDQCYSAYLKIADGCSRTCSFCAIPQIRGKACSRSINEIVDEALRLAECGVKELCLVSQDSCAYGKDFKDGTDLVHLIRNLNEIPDLAWIRLLYLYPDSVSDRLIKTVNELPKVVPYFDIPIQHISGKMLRKMHRGHDPSSIKSLITRIRTLSFDAFIRTTVLVGFPEETEEDFAELYRFLERTEFEHLGAFRYSREEGTRSYFSEPTVSARESYNRYRKVMALGKRVSRRRNKRLVGKGLEVLVEGYADEQGFVRVGRHKGQAPEVDGVTYIVSSTARPGDIIRVKVIKAEAYDLVVEPIIPCV